jgi:hypothetical protein
MARATRRVDPRTGEILETLEMPPGVGVSWLESDGGDQFFCGGGRSGKVRTVRRPKRGSASTLTVLELCDVCVTRSRGRFGLTVLSARP